MMVDDIRVDVWPPRGSRTWLAETKTEIRMILITVIMINDAQAAAR